MFRTSKTGVKIIFDLIAERKISIFYTEIRLTKDCSTIHILLIKSSINVLKYAHPLMNNNRCFHDSISGLLPKNREFYSEDELMINVNEEQF